MSTNVVMPQMGESIAEGTIIRWMKKVGEPVDRDEPLFEISTDKVDAEIPSPAAGVVTEIRAKEGETVPINSVVAIIGEAGEQKAESGGLRAEGERKAEDSLEPARGAAPPSASERGWGPASAENSLEPAGADAAAGPTAGAGRLSPDAERAPKPAREAVRPAERPPEPTGQTPKVAETPSEAAEEEEEGPDRIRSSPLVRRIAREHGIDLSQLHGTGLGGRITKHDIMAVVERHATAGPAVAGEPARPAAAESKAPTSRPGEAVRVEKMSVMRKKIAEHMVLSRRTSAHVHSVFEIDYSRVAKIRGAKKADYERAGTNLTYLAFIAKAVVDALRAMPVINASIDGENIVYKLDINLGIAVALERGLIVPVVKRADEKNLLGLSRAIADLAERARTKQLKPEEVQGGTFTITNPGVFGAEFGMPIINQPQVAILGVGAIEKRVVVIDDAIAIRPRGYLTLGYDHRLIDGAVADQFLSTIKRQLENFDEDAA